MKQSSDYDSWLRAAAHASEVTPSAPVPTPPPGALLLDGRFCVGRQLGQGGMGAVYEAEDRVRGGVVALKTLFRSDTQLLLRLKREFRELSDMSHPNLVALHELFHDDGRWFFTMEWIRGVDLVRWVRGTEAGGCDTARLRDALPQLVRGLRALHRAGRVHRDVKPSNTLVETETGRVVLLDFGLVAGLDALTRAHDVVGTAAYMAPEQCAGAAPDPAADWYALGVMLFEALTGRLPFEGTREALMDPASRDDVPRPPDLAPGAPHDLSALCVDLLSPAPGDRPDGAEILRRLGPAHPAPPPPSVDAFSPLFVGRAAALSALEEALAEVRRSGEPLLVQVRGESGIGKSALLERFARRIAAHAMVLRGRCHPREHVPHKGLDGVVDDLARELLAEPEERRRDLRPPQAHVLARVFPVLADLGGSAGSLADPFDHVDPVRLRGLALGALRELLSRAAERRPLAILVDDVQWADADTFAALAALLRAPDAPPVLWVMGARDDWSDDALVTLTDRRRSLALGAISNDEARELVRAMGAGPQVDVDGIVAAAQGHPLFLSELVDQAERGARVRGVDEAIEARVAGLGPAERLVLELVALSARPLEPATLAGAADLPRDALGAYTRALEAKRLLRTAGPRAGLEPYHDRIRGAVDHLLVDARRAERHRRLATAIERHDPTAAAALAEHWSAGGEPARALAPAIAAAEQARDALAFDRAARLFRWALSLGGASGPQAGRIHRGLGDALANAGRGREAADAYLRAAALASAGDQADLERLAAEQLLRAGHIDEGLEVMGRVLSRLGMHLPRTVGGGLAQLLTERVRLAATPRRATFGPTSPEALRRLDTCWAVAVGLAHLDPLAGAVFQTRFLRLARRMGDPDREALGLAMAAVPAASAGPPAREARRLLDAAHELAARSVDPRVRAHLALAETQVAFLTGRWRETLHHGQRTVELFRGCTGVAWEVATAQRLSLACAWHTGRLAELVRGVQAVVHDARARGDRYALTQFQTTVVPVVHLAADAPERASAALAEASANWSRAGLFLQHWQHMQGRALVWLYEGRFDEALSFMDGHMTGVARTFLHRIQAIRSFTAFVRGTAAVGSAIAARAGREAFLRRAEREARTLARSDAGGASAALLRAQIAELRGEPQVALRFLSIADQGFARHDMQLLQAVSARALGKRSAGEPGDAHEDRARRWLAAQPLGRPDRFLRTLAPVFADD